MAWRSRGPTLGPSPGLGLDCKCLVAGPPLMGAGRTQPERATWGQPTVDPTPAGEQSKAGAPTTRSLDTETDLRGVERHLAGGEEA